MSEQPRSRRQTRAAILGQLLQLDGMFRLPLAKAVRLSEARLSRILCDLKAERLIEEVRRPAPHLGGSTGLVCLDSSVALAAIELTGPRLSVGVGSMSGVLHYTERLALPKTPTVGSVGPVFHDTLTLPGDWARRRRALLRQIGVSAPGLGRLSVSGNPITPCNIGRVRAMLGKCSRRPPSSSPIRSWRTPAAASSRRYRSLSCRRPTVTIPGPRWRSPPCEMS
jgi:hypothetical protein